ncbi:tyrosine-protein phosphatase 69D-like [Uranotaenia lowii]|uniref:tyrosine-protein phosphatase 69D-like n=1 Tax=Uranotaenia lowii TaxID=190385 RepID=UPI00247A941E|nr:tyrosine-protein phosphatase 69D-like [Uranotaenia lowii]
MATEDPQGITKFTKRINSEYSLQRGPILVHCSAGAGRTGIFVALDTLSQQLNEEGQVSIFNTICDMRYQRNFLVQSLKQYIFLYRALTELAYFGDTEIDKISLAATVESLKQPSSDNSDITKLEAQFQRLKSFQDDSRRTIAMGGSEKNKAKNRSDACVPYDKNRVILAPKPGHDNCTYMRSSHQYRGQQFDRIQIGAKVAVLEFITSLNAPFKLYLKRITDGGIVTAEVKSQKKCRSE